MNDPTEYIVLSLMHAASTTREGAESILAEHDALKRAEVLREAAAELWTKTLLADDCACVELLRAMAAPASVPVPVETAGDSEDSGTEYGLLLPAESEDLPAVVMAVTIDRERAEEKLRDWPDAGHVLVQRTVRYGAWTEVTS